MPDQTVHATSIKLGDTGCLIQGPSGSGKSLLALEMLDRYGENGALIADDRTMLRVENKKLIASCPAPIKGKVELYGRGIIEWPTIDQFTIDLIIELVDAVERMPPQSDFTCEVMGIPLKRIPVPNHRLTDLTHQRMLVEAGLFYK